MPLLSVGDPAGAAQSHGEDNFRHSALCGKGCKLHSLFLTAFTGRKKSKTQQRRQTRHIVVGKTVAGKVHRQVCAVAQRRQRIVQTAVNTRVHHIKCSRIHSICTGNNWTVQVLHSLLSVIARESPVALIIQCNVVAGCTTYAPAQA